MKEYCVYWFEDGEPRHEAFTNLPEAEMFSCMIRGWGRVEDVEVSEEDCIDFDELQAMFPDDFS